MPSPFPSQVADLLWNQKAFQLFRSGVLWLDQAGTILGSNGKLASFLQCSEQELLEKKIFEIAPHLNLLRWNQIWQTLLQEGEFHEETEYITSTGLLIPVRLDGVLFEFDDQVWSLFIVENLMERQRLQDLLQEMAKVGKVGGWEYDVVRQQVTITGECQSLLQLPGDISVHKVRSLLHLLVPKIAPEDWLALKHKLRISLKQGEPFDLELIFEKEAGAYQRLAITGTSQQSELAQTIKIYGSVKDISSFETKTEELYLTQFTIDHAKEMILWVRPDGSFAYVNHALCERLGYTREELMSLDSEAIAPDFDDHTREELWRALRQEKYMEYEIDLYTKEGKSFPLYSTLNYIKFKGQEFNCVYAVDYSERKKVEEQQLLAQFTLENAQEMVLWMDAEGHILFANNRFFEVTGYQKEELTELDNYAIINYSDQPKPARDKLWKTLRKEKRLELESELICKDQTILPVKCSLNYLNYNGKEMDCIFMRDWTRKKERDHQIEMASQVLENASELVFWVAAQGKITYANPAAYQTLDYGPGELLGVSLPTICLAKNLLGPEAKFEDEETLLKTATGSLLPVALSRSRAELDGEIVWCFIARNIFSRKKREAELEIARQKVEELSLRLKDENVLLKEEIQGNYDFKNIITQSAKYQQVLEQIGQVADSNATVLLLGETGTGKELLARAIHSESSRSGEPLIKVNCAALPENLIESELFGHEKGAFTGATQQKKGRFELADGATLFLDEVGEMPIALQPKLLRVLQEGEFERLGSTETIKVDVRVIAATNRDLNEMVQKGTFREDLYYRLNVFPIYNLPLRDRLEDLEPLIQHFTHKYNDEIGKRVVKIRQSDLKMLSQYDFPGNIRELENMVERAVILSKGKTLDLRASFNRNTKNKKRRNQDQRLLSFEEMQRKHIIKALKRTKGRVTGPHGAGKLLKLNDRTLASKIRKLGIQKKDYQ